MTKTKLLLNSLIIYFVSISSLSVYIFSLRFNTLNTKLYIISLFIISSIGITFFLGKKYMLLTEKEINRVKQRNTQKVVEEPIKQPTSWGEVLNNAKSKKI